MSTITQKKKKSIWLWVLIIIAFSAVIVAAVLHFLGIIDLSFIAVGFLGLQTWAALDVVNALLLDIGLIALGVVGYWILLTYFIGVKVTNQGNQLGPQTYAPTPSYPSPQQKDTETVIS